MCFEFGAQFGDGDPVERRDVAVLLMHNGELAQARAELRAYDSSQPGRQAPIAERSLVGRLLEKLDRDLSPAGAVELPLYTLETALAELPPVIPADRRRALTW